MSDAPLKKIIIPTDLKEAFKVQQQILEAVEAEGYCEDARFAIRLALDESLCNAIKHGNQGDPAKKVEIEYAVEADKVRLVVVDEGQGFNPAQLDDPTSGTNLERPSGRGVMLINAYMSEVRYNQQGNRVEMVKYRDCKLPEGRDEA